jgi:PLP dependent protein
MEKCVEGRNGHREAPMNSIAGNIRLVQDKIAKAAEKSGRSAGDIILLAISKTFPIESIVQAAEAGIRKFGENRVREAEAKIPQLAERHELEWHLVGHLQTNKAKRAAELFDMVHSIDSTKLAGKLDQASRETGKILPVLLQVDLGGEETKYGAESSQVREVIEALSRCSALRLNGLMTIPPYFDDPDKVRPYFAGLRELGETLESEQPGCLGRRYLSMGMSHDFEQAIMEGATIVRIGTAIFGQR